jgi:hypothetical protein
MNTYPLLLHSNVATQLECHVVGIGVSDSMRANAFHLSRIIPPILRPFYHVVISGIVNAADVTFASVSCVRHQPLAPN